MDEEFLTRGSAEEDREGAGLTKTAEIWMKTTLMI